MLILLLATMMLLHVGATTSWPACVDGFDLDGGDLDAEDLPATSPEECASLCLANANCTAYSYHKSSPCSDHGETCGLASGCCRLKDGRDMSPTSGGMKPNNNKCSCSALLRVPHQAWPMPRPPGPHVRNVLYILFDDLRPELPSSYGHEFVHAPNIKNLMDTGTVFRHAYCQIAVCSPSRMSFLTGRRPTATRTMNFMDHFRQADCGVHRPNTALEAAGEPITVTNVTEHQGGSGQCCTLCSSESQCAYWSYEKEVCRLFASSGNVSFSPSVGVLSGVSGTFHQWTSLPEVFKKGGWLTMGTGKVFHTEEGGTGPTPELAGVGMPPNQDPPSWTNGLSMSRVNEVAPMDDQLHHCIITVGSSTCPVDATLDGRLKKNKTSQNDGEFEDKIIANDAILKLRLGAHMWKHEGRPFMLAVGFRKPHLSFRFPSPFLNYYPGLAHVPLAKHPTLDATIPPIAHQDTGNPGQNPWTPMEVETARRFRLYYAATISWVDSQLGRVMDEFNMLGLQNDTVIIMHSDHGWSLGEQGEWQKFTNFELGARVPLIVRDPSKPPSVSDTIVELVDVMPTLMDLAGVPDDVLDGETLDGKTLRHFLDGHVDDDRVGLSLYPRCPNGNNPAKDSKMWWKNNACLFIDRTMYSFMGLSIRTSRWRYTEWRWWDGTRELPHWEIDPAGIELYDHMDDDGTDFDAFENLNLAHNASHEATRHTMAQLLREKYTSVLETPKLYVI